MFLQDEAKCVPYFMQYLMNNGNWTLHYEAHLAWALPLPFRKDVEVLSCCMSPEELLSQIHRLDLFSTRHSGCFHICLTYEKSETQRGEHRLTATQRGRKRKDLNSGQELGTKCFHLTSSSLSDPRSSGLRFRQWRTSLHYSSAKGNGHCRAEKGGRMWKPSRAATQAGSCPYSWKSHNSNKARSKCTFPKKLMGRNNY